MGSSLGVIPLSCPAGRAIPAGDPFRSVSGDARVPSLGRSYDPALSRCWSFSSQAGSSEPGREFREQENPAVGIVRTPSRPSRSLSEVWAQTLPSVFPERCGSRPHRDQSSSQPLWSTARAASLFPSLPGIQPSLPKGSQTQGGGRGRPAVFGDLVGRRAHACRPWESGNGGVSLSFILGRVPSEK